MKPTVIIVTGTESSGSKFISKNIAYSLGITKTLESWSGGGKITKGDITIFHKSQPATSADRYTELSQIYKKFPDHQYFFILTTRYYKISNSSKVNRFKRSNKQLIDNLANSRRILKEIIKSGEKYFIWNYETMLFLEREYFDCLYDFLHIDQPLRQYPTNIKDGNEKYLKASQS